jgi:hypothetical protein
MSRSLIFARGRLLTFNVIDLPLANRESATTKITRPAGTEAAVVGFTWGPHQPIPEPQDAP